MRRDRVRWCQPRIHATRRARRGSILPSIPTPTALESAARAVSGARAHAVLLANVGEDGHLDLAKSLIGIDLRIIRHCVAIAQVLADVLEGFHLLLPGLGEVGFAAGARRDAAENGARHGVLVDIAGGDYIDGDPLIFGD